MGTRNLTCVVQNGEYKFAKYGQWDGYLGSLGLGILTFLRDKFDRQKFLAGLANVSTVTKTQMKQFWMDAGAEPNQDWVNMMVSEEFKRVHPELSREFSGYELLAGIQNGTVKHSNPEVSFAGDSLFCEWAYVLDLDKNTFEVYKGFNTNPLPANERFASITTREKAGEPKEYYPVRLLKSYSLRRLPNDKTFLRLKSLAEKRDKELSVSERKVDVKAKAFVSD